MKLKNVVLPVVFVVCILCAGFFLPRAALDAQICRIEASNENFEVTSVSAVNKLTLSKKLMLLRSETPFEILELEEGYNLSDSDISQKLEATLDYFSDFLPASQSYTITKTAYDAIFTDYINASNYNLYYWDCSVLYENGFSVDLVIDDETGSLYVLTIIRPKQDAIDNSKIGQVLDDFANLSGSFVAKEYDAAVDIGTTEYMSEDTKTPGYSLTMNFNDGTTIAFDISYNSRTLSFDLSQ